jgi:transcription elongation factor
MNKDQEIQDIVNQLERLQIQQSDLLQRLGLLSERDDSNNTAIPLPASAREFAIGDRVRIKNPGRLQPIRGTITKIGRNRITVEARNGTKIVRAPKNLILES